MPHNKHDSPQTLEFIFKPRSIAIAGASEQSVKFSAGRLFVKSLMNSGFKGKIYPVHPKRGEIFGLKIYSKLMDIPEGIDYVISAIPALHAPQLVTDCAEKRVKAIHFFSAGFGETHEEQDRRLEEQTVSMARRNGIRIIGPNCLGLYCPKTGLSFGLDFPKKSGPIGLISQSGANSVDCLWEVVSKGIFFSKVISYGNAADLNETDFLEYLAFDSDTKIIAAYIEGLRDGERFLNVLKKTTAKKPVIVFKAATTETGKMSAASHTGALAGSQKIWEGLLKQTGAIQADSTEELVDIALLFMRIEPKKKNRVVIVGMGGGIGVKAADDCLNAGLAVPPLPVQARKKLKNIFKTEVGSSFRNPVDVFPFGGLNMFVEAIQVIADCKQVDLLIMHLGFDVWALIRRKYAIEIFLKAILKLKRLVKKPIAVVLFSHSTDEGKRLASETQSRLCNAGFPVYPSVERAARSFKKFVQYHQWIDQRR